MKNMTPIRTLTMAAVSLVTSFSGFQSFAETPKPEKAASAELAGHPLQQVALTTSDLSAAIDFYRNRLGLPFLFESNGMAFFDMAGIRLMVAYDADRPVGRPTSILYFEVDRFHEAVDRLIAAEVALDGPIETVQKSASGDLKIQQFRDLDGNALAVIGLVRSAG